MLALPAQILVEARLSSHALADPGAETTARLDGALGSLPCAGKRVAVAVGSRGIDRLPVVVRAVVDWLRAAGAKPFIIPAMGSHGGATPRASCRVLAEYGVTEAAMGAPVRPSHGDRERSADRGRPADVRFSAEALAADGIVVINRVKPHTDFGGRARQRPHQDVRDRPRQAATARPPATPRRRGSGTSA